MYTKHRDTLGRRQVFLGSRGFSLQPARGGGASREVARGLGQLPPGSACGEQLPLQGHGRPAPPGSACPAECGETAALPSTALPCSGYGLPWWPFELPSHDFVSFREPAGSSVPCLCCAVWVRSELTRRQSEGSQVPAADPTVGPSGAWAPRTPSDCAVLGVGLSAGPAVFPTVTCSSGSPSSTMSGNGEEGLDKAPAAAGCVGVRASRVAQGTVLSKSLALKPAPGGLIFLNCKMRSHQVASTRDSCP